MKTDLVPFPPKSATRWKGYKWEPMTVDEAKYWITRYNDWVEVWNIHEKSKELPLSPEWGAAISIGGAVPASAITFRPLVGGKAQDKTGVMKFYKFNVFHKGWSFCKNPLVYENLKWAGWNTYDTRG